jgi:hypothetical protein
MSVWELLEEKRGGWGPSLRRGFWLPLRHWLRMFHILPVSAAVILFFLLATDGQIREIYVSYLEDLQSGGLGTTIFRFAAAALGFALISAVLFEAHYLLGKARFDLAYPMNADPGAGSNVQDAAAILLALSPWLGLVTGLVHAKIYLADLFALLQQARAPDLYQMQYVPMPSRWAITMAVMVLGLVMSFFVAVNPKSVRLQRAVIIVTPPAAALLFVLLIEPPQFNPGAWQIVAASAAVAAFVAVYYFFYTILYAMRPHVFSRTLQEKTGINLRRFQPLLLFVWALMPWAAAIAIYFWSAPPPAKQGEQHGWAMIPVAMSWTVSIGLSVVFLLYRYRKNPALRWSIYGTVAVLAATGLFVSWLSPDTIVIVYRLVGPLGSLALAVLFLISIFVLLVALSQQSGFPALTLVLLVLVGSVVLPIPIYWTVGALALLCLIILGMAITSGLWAVAAVALILAITGGINFEKMRELTPRNLRQTQQGSDLTQQFASWLDYHIKATEADTDAATQSGCSGKFQQYPVYIVAVAGGGIYAASAASVFLARLQDRAPCFAEHVFAISAVSGGAIGATIFQTLVQSRLPAAPAPVAPPAAKSAAKTTANACLPPPITDAKPDARRDLEQDVADVIKADHFSPLVASIFPELLGFTRSGRAQELAASFENSVNRIDRKAAQALCQPFSSDWSYESNAPALVLNATWVETGYRAAFAPFPLHAIDDSLYSFADQNMPADLPRNPVTTIDAALVSARFPGILPPYSVLVNSVSEPRPGTAPGQSNTNSGSSPEMLRWNFVDGGYSDTSGATTALVLYQALKDTAASRNVQLRVILVTSSDPRLDPNKINGTVFGDTLAPVDAMLSVRAGLGNEAVARACNGIAGDAANGKTGEKTCEDFSADASSPLQIVGVEDQTYGLSLGWKISQTSFNVVSWMLGEPQFASEQVCQGPLANSASPSPQANGQFTLNEKVVCANSRVLAAVLESLGYKQGQ